MKRLKQLGFIEIRQKGSHHIYKRQDPSTQKPSGPIVVVPGSTGKEIPQGTLRSIESQLNSALCIEDGSPHLA